MQNPAGVLMAELVMSIDRLIRSAQVAETFEGEWAPQVILGHISQVDELVWLPRIAQMCQAPKGSPPEFTWWEPDATATQEKFEGLEVDQVAALAMSNRTNLLSAIKNLTPDQWAATAKHDTFGVINVSGLVIEILTHDEEHRAGLIPAT